MEVFNTHESCNHFGLVRHGVGKSGQLCGASASPDMLCNIERSIGASNTGKNCNQEWKTVFFELLLQLSFANSCNRATMVEVLRSFQMCTNPLID
jgi:hypothetical protein